MTTVLRAQEPGAGLPLRPSPNGIDAASASAVTCVWYDDGLTEDPSEHLLSMPLAHPSTLDRHRRRSSADGGVVVEGVGAGCPAGIAGGLSHSGGASIAFVDFFKLGITYWVRSRAQKRATIWSPSQRFGL